MLAHLSSWETCLYSVCMKLGFRAVLLYSSILLFKLCFTCNRFFLSCLFFCVTSSLCSDCKLLLSLTFSYIYFLVRFYICMSSNINFFFSRFNCYGLNFYVKMNNPFNQLCSVSPRFWCICLHLYLIIFSCLTYSLYIWYRT